VSPEPSVEQHADRDDAGFEPPGAGLDLPKVAHEHDEQREAHQYRGESERVVDQRRDSAK
jgi:hypothetical protein